MSKAPEEQLVIKPQQIEFILLADESNFTGQLLKWKVIPDTNSQITCLSFSHFPYMLFLFSSSENEKNQMIFNPVLHLLPNLGDCIFLPISLFSAAINTCGTWFQNHLIFSSKMNDNIFLIIFFCLTEFIVSVQIKFFCNGFFI